MPSFCGAYGAMEIFMFRGWGMFFLTLALLLSACGGSSQDYEDYEPDVVLRVAFENSLYEPIGIAMLSWKDSLHAMDIGFNIELFPYGQMAMADAIQYIQDGEGVMTLADGAFFADLGIHDLGIVFGAFLFNNWEEVWALNSSTWFAEQMDMLGSHGMVGLSHNWKFSERHLMTSVPVHNVYELGGLRIRVPNNNVQALGLDAMGANTTAMGLGDVHGALQSGTIDGVENPLSVLYNRRFYDAAGYIILTGHILNATTWITSNNWFNDLTIEQQNALTQTLNTAANHNNNLLANSNEEYMQMLQEAGVTFYKPTNETLQGFRERAQVLYTWGETFGWSKGLYEIVRDAILEAKEYE